MKYSKQREEILEYVKSVKTHPTAKMVYDNLKKTIPNLSLGTVYRDLSVLSESGKLQRIKIANEKDRFDGDLSSHFHAKCVKCGEIFDIDACDFLNYDKDIEKKLDCVVLSHDVIVNILCSKCKNI